MSNISYKGINGSQLEILGVINLNVKIHYFEAFLKFYVVPDTTISYDCLIGRNLLTLNLGNKIHVEVNKYVYNEADNDILRIHYVKVDELNDFKIDDAIPIEYRQKVNEMLNLLDQQFRRAIIK